MQWTLLSENLELWAAYGMRYVRPYDFSKAGRASDMTPTEYKSRIKALGFPSGASWARYVGITRGAHTRHTMEPHQPNSRDIPKTLILILERLESGEYPNPNAKGKAS